MVDLWHKNLSVAEREFLEQVADILYGHEKAKANK